MVSRYELQKSSDDQYYFNVVSGNNEKILTSERYTSKSGAENGIESCRENAPLDERYERGTAANDEPYFVLKAANNEIIERSETHSSTQAMENGITAVKRDAPDSPVEDMT